MFSNGNLILPSLVSLPCGLPPVASSLLLFPEDWLVRLCLQCKCNLENRENRDADDRSEKSDSEERRDTKSPRDSKSHAAPLRNSHSRDLSLGHPGAVLPSSPPSLRCANIKHAHLIEHNQAELLQRATSKCTKSVL